MACPLYVADSKPQHRAKWPGRGAGTFVLSTVLSVLECYLLSGSRRVVVITQKTKFKRSAQYAFSNCKGPGPRLGMALYSFRHSSLRLPSLSPSQGPSRRNPTLKTLCALRLPWRASGSRRWILPIPAINRRRENLAKSGSGQKPNIFTIPRQTGIGKIPAIFPGGQIGARKSAAGHGDFKFGVDLRVPAHKEQASAPGDLPARATGTFSRYVALGPNRPTPSRTRSHGQLELAAAAASASEHRGSARPGPARACNQVANPFDPGANGSSDSLPRAKPEGRGRGIIAGIVTRNRKSLSDRYLASAAE
jgi:hypothetical protein